MKPAFKMIIFASLMTLWSGLEMKCQKQSWLLLKRVCTWSTRSHSNASMKAPQIVGPFSWWVRVSLGGSPLRGASRNSPSGTTTESGQTVGYTPAMFDWVTLLTSLTASGVLSVTGAGVLARYVADRSIIRYKAEVEAKTGHRVYVTKAHFDTEFGALKESFVVLGRLRLAFNTLRPVWDFMPDEEAEQIARMKERLEKFREKYEASVDVAQTSYPFVPAEIHEHFQTCLRAAHHEIRTIEGQGDRSIGPDGRQKGAEQHQRFEDAYNNAVRLVRDRLSKLSILPE